MERPVFLVGSERSGSTLLRVILDHHPSICAPAPPHLLTVFPRILHLYGSLEKVEHLRDLAADMLKIHGARLGEWRTFCDADALLERCGERSFAGLFDALYAIECERRGKQRYFVKDNGAAENAFFVASAFPRASFVYLVRDPRDVVASWLDSPPHFGGTAHAAEVWALEQEESLRAYSVFLPEGRMHLVHYEDLVARPKETLKDLCRFLGEEYTPTLLDFHRGEEARASARAIDAWKNVASPITSERVGSFRNRLQEAQVRRVEEVAATEMMLLGYNPSLPPGERRPGITERLAVNPYIEAIRRFAGLLTGTAGRREVGRRVKRLGTLRSVERRIRSSRRPWSSPGGRRG